MNKLLLASAVWMLFPGINDAQLRESDQQAFLRVLRQSEMVRTLAEDIERKELPYKTVASVYLLLSNTSEVEIHRMKGASNNKVYLSKDGKHEAVYGTDNKLVEDGINDGSYNYFHPNTDPLRHFCHDIVPWLMYGASRHDPTSRKERIHAYSADIFCGVLRLRKNKGAVPAIDTVALNTLGSHEGAAFFLAAVKEGNADRLIAATDIDNDFSEAELLKAVEDFEAGLASLLDGAKTPKQWIR